jgi:hypothetical protein
MMMVPTDHKTARKTKNPRKIPIGHDYHEIVETAIGDRTSGLAFLSSKGEAIEFSTPLSGIPKDSRST